MVFQAIPLSSAPPCRFSLLPLHLHRLVSLAAVGASLTPVADRCIISIACPFAIISMEMFVLYPTSILSTFAAIAKTLIPGQSAPGAPARPLSDRRKDTVQRRHERSSFPLWVISHCSRANLSLPPYVPKKKRGLRDLTAPTTL